MRQTTTPFAPTTKRPLPDQVAMAYAELESLLFSSLPVEFHRLKFGPPQGCTNEMYWPSGE